VEKETSRCQKITGDEIQTLGLKYKIPGIKPYKCIINAFNNAGFERT
jgi:hypothetical protein